MNRQLMSEHAIKRADQRGIRRDEIDAAMRYGRMMHRPGGAVAYFVGKKEIRRAKKDGVNLSGLNGMTVVLNTQGYVPLIITAYKNKSLKDLKKNRGWARVKQDFFEGS